MASRRKKRIYQSQGLTKAGDAARSEQDAAGVASRVRTDAVTAGLVRSANRYAQTTKKSPQADVRASGRRRAKAKDASSTSGSRQASDQTGGAPADEPTLGKEKSALQAKAHIRAYIADAAVEELDDSEELEGISSARQKVQSGAYIARRIGYRAPAKDALVPNAPSKQAASKTRQAGSQAKPASQQSARHEASRKTTINANTRRVSKAQRRKSSTHAAKARMQSRRTWLAARSQQVQAGRTAQAAGTARRAGGAKTLAAALSSAAAPLAGVLAGVVCFVLCVLLVSQMVSALFGFWDNEAKKVSLEGLPPYITAEMVEAALACQEKYGHPAGCTLAQIICESGVGDHLSGLATQDKNLFGIKWASSFLGAPEVSGKSAWSTQEEYGGQIVTIMADFTSFKSFEDCIRFRSRVLLANSRYADNALIKQAIANKDSDKMAEGLKDAGYATSSAYVDSLKSILDTYGLRRFDGVSLEDYKKGSANGNAVVAAAMTQLGVPYVWGGTTPGVGLDCSGLTQYAYAKAGIAIPRNSEDQANAGRKIPLSQAKPGDILWRPGHVAIYAGGDTYIHEPHSGASCTTSTGIAYFTCAVRF